MAGTLRARLGRISRRINSFKFAIKRLTKKVTKKTVIAVPETLPSISAPSSIIVELSDLRNIPYGFLKESGEGIEDFPVDAVLVFTAPPESPFPWAVYIASPYVRDLQLLDEGKFRFKILSWSPRYGQRELVFYSRAGDTHNLPWLQ
jgi:hypothetical protein